METAKEKLKKLIDSQKNTKSRYYPLTSYQNAIWEALHESPGKLSHFEIFNYVEIKGYLNCELFEKALQQVIDCTSALRLQFTISSNNNTLEQTISESRSAKLEVIDFSQKKIDPDNEIRKWIVQNKNKILNPLKDVPYYWALLKLSDNKFYWYARYSQLIADEDSVFLISNKVSEAYTCLINSSSVDLKNDIDFFVGYLKSETEYPYSAKYFADRDYWMQTCRGNAATDISVKNKTVTKEDKPLREFIRHAEEDVYGARLCASRLKINFPCFLICTITLYLQKILAKTEITLGLSTTSCLEGVSKDLVAPQANFLPILFDADPSKQLINYAQKVNEHLDSVIVHGQYCYKEFERFLDVQPDGPGLFNISLNILSTSQEINFGEATGVMHPVISHYTDSLMISIVYDQDTDRMYTIFDGNPYRHESWELNLHLQRYQSFFHDVAKSGVNFKLEELSALSNDEYRNITQLFSLNETEKSYLKSIHSIFESKVTDNPDAIAVVCGEESLTYMELNNKANQLARFLRQHGVVNNSLVAIYLDRSLDLIISLFSVLKAGGIYVPVDTQHPVGRLSNILEEVSPLAVITQEKYKKNISCPAMILPLDYEWSHIGKYPDYNLKAHGVNDEGEQLIYVIYTSGSTGQPKGVCVKHSGINNLLQWYIHEFKFSESDRNLIVSSFSFDLTQKNLFCCLLTGGELHLAPEPYDPAAIVRCIEQNRITTMNLAPSAFYPIIESGINQNSLSSLREVFLGGEAINITRLRPLIEKYPQIVITNHYGPTECSDVSTFHRLDTESGFEELQDVPIGKPIWNAEVYLFDEHHKLVPIGMIGEIYIGGVGVGQGYFKAPELTEVKFIPNPFREDSRERLYKTGDFARWLPDGNLEFIGRIDDQVKIRGNRVELGEIEKQIATLGSVKECTVLTHGDKSGDIRLVAYVVFKSGPDSETIADPADTLRRYLGNRLPEYMIPSAYVVLGSLPLNANGKIDKRALPAPGGDDYALTAYVAPQTESERLLVEIWAELLELEQGSISTMSNFFAVGGYSLLIIRMITRLKLHGLIISVREVLETSTLAELAAALDNVSDKAVFTTPPNLIPDNCTYITPEMLPLISLSKGELEIIAQSVPGGMSNIKDIYPLAPLQEGLFFHYLMDSDYDPYILPILLTVDSRPQLDELLRALQWVVNRHDVLRTAILRKGLSKTVQVVYRQAELYIEDIVVESGKDVLRQLQAMVANPPKLDLGCAPLLGISVVQDTGSDQWFMLLRLHHIVIDHVGFDIINEEVFHKLTEYYTGQNLPALPTPVPYRNFVAYALHRDATRDAQSYFQRLLADVSEPTLPFNLANVHGDGRESGNARSKLSVGLSTAIREVARTMNISPATIFHAAWAMVVGACSGRNDVVFGTVLSGRLHGTGTQDTERMMGTIINTLPMRIRMGGKSIKQLVNETEHQLRELLEHEQASLALVQRYSGLGNDKPLFSAVFNYRQSRMVEVEDEDVIRKFGFRSISGQERINYPFGISADDLGDIFALSADMDLSISPKQIISYMERALEELAEALQESGDRKINTLSIIPENERHQQLITWNDTQTDYPREKCIHELFEAQVERSPDNKALVFEGASLSYRELNEQANQVAHYLLGMGMGPDTLVGLCVERSMVMIIGLLGILKSGCAYVPVDPEYPAERIKYILEDSGATVVISQSHLANQLPFGSQQLLHLDMENEREGDAANIKSQPTTNIAKEDLQLTSKHLAFVIYTSGSTGKPKGVLLNHYGLVNLAITQGQLFTVTDDSRVLQFASLSFDAATWEIFMSLGQGACLYLITEQQSKSSDELTTVVVENQITHATLTPVLLGYLDPEILSSLSTLIVAGEAISESLAESWRAGRNLFNAYGPTEATVCVTVGKYDGGKIHIGRSINNMCCYVCNLDLKLLPIGVPGELYVSGDGIARGYLNNIHLTLEKFITNPFDNDSYGLLYRTGDLVRWLPGGNLEFIGRIDHQVKIRGFRVELGEVEATLNNHPDLQSVAVTVHEKESVGKQLVAYVCPKTAYLDELTESLNADSIDRWSTITGEQYSSSSTSFKIDQNFIGWNNSYTGEPIALEQMQEWLEGTIQRVEALKPINVLEIGCGTGLLLFRYAEACKSVYATDISTVYFPSIQEELDKRGWKHVKLGEGDALSIDPSFVKAFDTVVINSVVQYFPNRQYLEQMLEKLFPCIVPGGRIFIGDVRNLDLLEAHYSAVERAILTESIQIDTLSKRVQRRIRQEEELLLSPSYFAHLPDQFPEIESVDIMVKRGLSDNEMLRYRYDVVVHKAHSPVDKKAATTQTLFQWHDYRGMEDIEFLLSGSEESCFGISGVPNARVKEDVALAAGLKNWEDNRVVNPPQTAGRISSNSEKANHALESLLCSAEEKGYKCGVTWSQEHLDHLDIIFSRPDLPVIQSCQAYQQKYLANFPQLMNLNEILSTSLRVHVEEHLPDYMVPNTFIILERMPLTPSGKIDKRALPIPDEYDLDRAEYVAPRNNIERKLCQMWQELLQLERVGIHDNFFKLGGQSLLATHLVSLIRQDFNKELSLRVFFETPTISDLCQELQEMEDSFVLPSIEPLDRNNNKSVDDEELEF